MEIETRGDATVLSLKQQLQTRPIDGALPVSPQDQHYVHDTRVLPDDRTLASSGVYPGDTVFVVLSC